MVFTDDTGISKKTKLWGLRNLIEKVESILKRMRWKARFFLKGEKVRKTPNISAFRVTKHLPSFWNYKENDLKLYENIKFRDTKNHFQETLANDLKKINSSGKMFVFAHKTRNIHETSFDTCSKLLHDDITKTYKHDLRTTFRRSTMS